MTLPDYSVSFSAPVSGTSAAGSAGMAVVKNAADGMYVPATSAARGSMRSSGVALKSFTANGVVNFKQFGDVDPTITGLGAGAASWVRVSTTGTLERCTPGTGDDVCGFCEADGTLHACFGFLTAAMVNGGGGGGFTPPTGTGFMTVTGGVMDTAATAEPLAASLGGTGASSLPAGGLVGATATQTLSNKTIAAGSTNTITGLTPANDAAASAMAALAIDWSAAGVFTKTLGAGSNTITFTNASSGRVIVVRLTGAGTSTVTWPTVKWAGGTPPTQTPGGTDVYTFVHDGTNIYGSVVQAMA